MGDIESKRSGRGWHRACLRFFLLASVFIAVSFAACPPTCTSTTEQLVTSDTPYVELQRNAQWTKSGIGGFENNYIFSLSDPDIGVCLYVTNLDTAQHTFFMMAFQTGDPSVLSFKDKQGKWRPVMSYVEGSTTTPNGLLQGTPLLTGVSPASTTLPIFIQAKAAARISINLSDSTTASGAADLYVVQTHGNQCSQLAASPQSFIGAYLNNFGIVPWTAMSGTSMPPSPPALNATNLPYGSVTSPVAMMQEKGPRWGISDNQTGAIASASKPAQVGVRHVIDCFGYSAVSTGATAALANSIQFLNGAFASGVPLFCPTCTTEVILVAMAAAAGAGITLVPQVTQCGLNLIGSANTALTVNWGFAGANIREAIWITGYDVQ